MQEEHELKTARHHAAVARGRRIRAQIAAQLREGPRSAEVLHREMDLESDVSLPEVVFQLSRMAEEGMAAGEPGGPYRLAQAAPGVRG